MAAVMTRSFDLPSRTSTPPPHLTINTNSTGTAAPVSNKHIPFCSPGPRPSFLLSPPCTPPSTSVLASHHNHVLYPPDPYSKISDDPPVYKIDATTVAGALEEASKLPLPDPKLVFPWLHGLHCDNQIQLAFFGARRRSSRKVPRCLRGVTIVKAGGDLNLARIKGALSPDELLSPPTTKGGEICFHDPDPRMGFSVRNFQVQACKMATVSDIIVYGDETIPRDEVEELAKAFARAQIYLREDNDPIGNESEDFNTFLVTDDFETFEKKYPEIVAVDHTGNFSGKVLDFLSQERQEMACLSKASEIANNVWLGPTPNPANTSENDFDMFVETSDLAMLPDLHCLSDVERSIVLSDSATGYLDFPSSGSIAVYDHHLSVPSEIEADRLMEVLHWLHKMANPDASQKDQNGDTIMKSNDTKASRILIHCTDGYTENSLLAIAYFMFVECLPTHEAWVRLHCEKGRNFFAYPTDKALLESMEARIMRESPSSPTALIPRPQWMDRMDGSLPSRILSYLYLGNLGHAENPALLKRLGVTRILSVGEPIRWSDEDVRAWGKGNFLFIDNVQDNGVDILVKDFETCLAFIEAAKSEGGATLVHCRVGVSRSATICIAEVMNTFDFSFPRAYCFVRARRLNVIIQPHLRFSYELLKWEETRREKQGLPVLRELEWATIAREIALMNKPYCRQ